MTKTWWWPLPAQTCSLFDLEYNILLNISCVIDFKPTYKFISTYQLPPHYTELLAAGWNFLFWKLNLQCLWSMWYNFYLTILLVNQNK